MSEKKPIQMRRSTDAAAARKRALALAGAVGAAALAIAVVAVLIGTFPRPSATTPASSSTERAVTSVVKAVAASATAEATSTRVAVPVVSKSAPLAVKKPPKKVAKRVAVKAPAPVVLPLGMASVLPGSKQLIVATGSKLGATYGTLRIFNLANGTWKQVLSAPARFGTYGLVDGTKRKQGSRMTPTGIWWPGAWVWGWHKSPPAGTSMPYRQTTTNVWWSDEANTYNQWVVSSRHVSGEHLVDVRIQYEYALSTGYNSPPNQVVHGRGTAIFLHVFDPPDYHNGLSAGCVAIARADMIRVLQTMNPALKPSFAVGTEAAGAGAIASY
ncbi:MAG: L,D-transpeptidase family protein [Coriobacteriia bacterium]|nr:L,D-transpeptidase family protein [Coriobacteriia bacterium]